jgi:glucose-6-phosphate isomerase
MVHADAIWTALKQHHRDLAQTSMRQLFAEDRERFHQFSISAFDVELDYSKNKITATTLDLLLQLAQAKQLPEKIQAMFSGAKINSTEDRAVSHVALRHPDLSNAQGDYAEIAPTLARMQAFTSAVHRGDWKGHQGDAITDVVSLGIGGSFLGPKMVTEALKPFHTGHVHCHYVANIDGTALHRKLQQLNPATTLFVIASKSFTTQETLFNAEQAKAWLLDSGAAPDAIGQHFVAISARPEKAMAFGIQSEQVFPLWDWVGGRYSLWSAIGLPIMLSVGYSHFQALLQGAHLVDRHFESAPLAENMPVIMGLIGIWNSNLGGAQSHALLPYSHALRAFPAYIQQQDMESNGKSVQLDGNAVETATGPVIWGGEGTNGQHAFHQLLHQGTRAISVDFILPLQSCVDAKDHHQLLASHCFAQSQALMQGRSLEEAMHELEGQGLSPETQTLLAKHKAMPGDRASNTLLLPKVTPESVGSLIALYEHKTFVQSVIWNINAFDQWGVELGKRLGEEILIQLQSNAASAPQNQDASTAGLIARFKQHQ